MLIVISPAKTLDLDSPASTEKFTQPDFMTHSAELIATLRTLSPTQIGSLMRISEPLAQLNTARYNAWSPTFTPDNAKQAVLAFNGDVYDGLGAASLDIKQLDYTQAHLRILSGLYGLLRPLDLMQAYRLEMGTRLPNLRGRNLYEFWGEMVTEALNAVVVERNADALINLASEEYFKVVTPAQLTVPVITPVFEDWKNGKYKVISFYAKRARGLMARFAAQNGVIRPAKLKSFNLEGYAFDEEHSNDSRWLFRRRLAD